MKIDTDISYCEPHQQHSLCTSCRRNINLYGSQHHGLRLWYVVPEPKYIEGKFICESYMPLEDTETSQ